MDIIKKERKTKRRSEQDGMPRDLWKNERFHLTCDRLVVQQDLEHETPVREKWRPVR